MIAQMILTACLAASNPASSFHSSWAAYKSCVKKMEECVPLTFVATASDVFKCIQKISPY